MKVLKKQILVVIMILCGVVNINAMINRPSLFKNSIKDIQEYAHDREEYPPVINFGPFKGSLAMLGLTLNSTPLDIKYHYGLFLKKLTDNDPFYKQNPLYEAIQTSYSRIMWVLQGYKEYRNDLDMLLAMDFDHVQEMELNNKDVNTYLKDKLNIINGVIDSFQYKLKITDMLELPVLTSDDAIENAYFDYIKKNDPNRLIALRTVNKINSKELKRGMRRVKEGKNLNETMLQLEKIKQAYADYLQTIQQLKENEDLDKKMLRSKEAEEVYADYLEGIQ